MYTIIFRDRYCNRIIFSKTLRGKLIYDDRNVFVKNLDDDSMKYVERNLKALDLEIYG